ncbi:lipid-A-disaccharide synthase [Silvanigrella paludirubra]|uniref:Lipid-A-disaccharide synthase n=1 Tax=Silvanigrella paludirubra TaxID=2499159 RepID=A0A6N6VQ84_9BACT|nr:lipid-A-disaccharide synthase [Silvanigrella paludirubra]KAB8037116.1 lipid-A-disaccharide synthase [Silvanigrella paludirubra]
MQSNLNGGICIIAGEASGDAQGALLVKALKEEYQNKNVNEKTFWGSSGPLMRKEGVEDIIKVEDLAVFGLVEIISHYPVISACYKKILNEIKVRKPEAVILIDYPGFNLKLLQDVYSLGNTVIYHIPPKAWSHGKKRTELLKNYCHLVTSILPFETQFFKDNGVNTFFAGNPLKDNVDEYLSKNKTIKVPFKIGILPGSRKNEIQKLLPILIESFVMLSEKESKITGAIPIAPTLDPNFVKDIAYKSASNLGYTKEWIDQKISFGVGNAYEVMSTSSYAWVCSGTATLETAFFNTPMCVIYKISPITAYIARKLIFIKYVSLVNLTENSEIIPEYLQEMAKPIYLVNHALKVFHDKDYETKMLINFQKVQNVFPKNAAKNAAQEIIKCIDKYNVPNLNKFKYHRENRTVK